jgi:hypothetical protein
MTPRDAEHLRLLSIFHYILAGLVFLFGLVFIVHFGLGLAALLAPAILDSGGPDLPPIVGLLFLAGGAIAMGGSWTLAVLMAVAGRFLARRRHRTFCIVVAALECLFQPLGTVLGVFTIVILLRDSVKAAFDAEPPPEEWAEADLSR